MPKLRAISQKQKIFLQEYTKSLNLAKSVKKAYPNMSYGTARSYGVFLKKTHPIVSKEIKKIHEMFREAIDPTEMILQLQSIYDKSINTKDILVTKINGKVVLEKEVSCTERALKALKQMGDILLATKNS